MIYIQKMKENSMLPESSWLKTISEPWVIGPKSTNGTWTKESNFPVSDTEKEEKIVVKQDTKLKAHGKVGNCQFV